MPLSNRLQNHAYTPVFDALYTFFETGAIAPAADGWEVHVLPKQPLSYVTMDGTIPLETVSLTDLQKASLKGIGKFRQPISVFRLTTAFFKGDTTATRVMPRLLAIKQFDGKDKDSWVLVCLPVFEAGSVPRSADVPVVLYRCSSKKDGASLLKLLNRKKSDGVFTGQLELVLPPAAHANVTWDKAHRSFVQTKVKKAAAAEGDSDNNDDGDDSDVHPVGKKRPMQEDEQVTEVSNKRAQSDTSSETATDVPPEPVTNRRSATTTPGITAAIRAMLDAIERQAPGAGMQVQLLITQKLLSEADLCAMTRHDLHEAGFHYGLASLVLRCRANHLPSV